MRLMDVAKLVDTYAKGAEHLKKIQERQDTLKKMLVKAIDEDGQVDDKGHRWLAAGDYMLQRQKRQGARYLDKERALLWADGQDILDQVQRVIVDLDEDKLAGWVYDHRNDRTFSGTSIQEEYDALWVTPAPTFAFMPPQKGTQYEY